MNRRSLVLLAISLVLTIVSAAPAACSQGGRTAVRAGVLKPSSEELEGRATAATGAPATRESQVRIWTIHYSAHNGADRLAYVILPASYGPGHDDPPLPLVISPHGRGGNGRTNAKLWGDLPAVGGFAVVNPDGMGRRLKHFSYGYPGQIDDLAKMPDFVTRALPWLQIDRRRIYAVGSSMGGQETLLLVARHPRLLAGAAALDSDTDMRARYYAFPQLPGGLRLQQLAREEIGGTPANAARAYTRRSPIDWAAAIARSGVPLHIWWSTRDRIVRNQ